MPEVEKLFGARVRELRLGKGWSQGSLAKRVGMHYTSLAKLESATRRVTLDESVTIAAVLGVPLGDLLNDPSVSPKVQRLREELTTATADEMRWRGERDMALDRLALDQEQFDLAAHEHDQAEKRVTRLRAEITQLEQEGEHGKPRKKT